MKIAIREINDKPVNREEDIPANLWEMDSSDITFADDIHLDCTFTRVSDTISVSDEITSYRDITCVRCLGQKRQVAKQKFQRDYNIKKSGEDLDINSDLREEVILNLPMKVLCIPDCKGICPGCGVNLNTDQCKCQR